MRKQDLSLYFVAHCGNLSTEAFVDLVLQAIEGGVTIVQLREKNCTFKDFCALGAALLARLRPLGIPLIINDRADVAKAIGADGVHIGQTDMQMAEARALLGPDAIIGLTVNNFEEGRQADTLDVDYLGAGPIWPTATKLDCGPPWDLADLEKLCRLSPHPIVGIGGINASNIAGILPCGVAGAAVVSAILNAPCPRSAAEELAEQWKHYSLRAQ